jgi:hypothetical protein
MKLPYIALGLGLAAYCLVLLISKDALIETINILGIGALALISITLYGLWIKGSKKQDIDKF